MLADVLEDLQQNGLSTLPSLRPLLSDYLEKLTQQDPDTLDHDQALAYWLNAYNAGALLVAGDAYERNRDTVLRVPGAFTTPMIEVAGESLSLDGVEHGKIRRFGDPRIHSALVCGSVSCPTLRSQPFDGDGLQSTLEDQMRTFMASGGAVRDADRLVLSRIFLWYGADFVRPDRMPTVLPARRRRLALALANWLPAELAAWVRAEGPSVSFLPYDWTLSCSVG